jgi:hypothetical protein
VLFFFAEKNDEHTMKRISDAERLNQNLQMFQHRQQSMQENPLQQLEDMQYDLTRQVTWKIPLFLCRPKQNYEFSSFESLNSNWTVFFQETGA